MKKCFLSMVIIVFFMGVSGVTEAEPYRNLFLTSIDIIPYHGFEVGARLSTMSADYLDSGMAAQASFRYGLFNKVEVEAIVPYYRFEPKGGDSINGLGKVSLGITYSKIQTQFLEFGFSGGILLPNADSDLAYVESGADGIDLRVKGLINFPIGDVTSIQGNLGYIVTGEGDSGWLKDVNPDDIITYDIAFNHLVFDRKLKLILELNGMQQDEIARQALTPAVRWEFIPALVFEGFASISFGSETDRLYDTMLGIGFTYEFFKNTNS